MNCLELEPFIDPYLDDALGGVERTALESHVESCESCGEKVATQADFRLALKRKLLEHPPDQAPRELRALVKQGFVEELQRARLQTIIRWGAAAMVVVCVSGVWSHWRVSPRQRLLADAARRHARRLPVEIAAPEERVLQAWFDGKLDYAVPLPHLANAKLAGARLSHVTDRDAAYLAYEAHPPGVRTVQRVSVFVIADRDSDVARTTWPDVELEEIDGYHVAVWRTGEVAYELVSDMDEASVRELLRPSAVRPQPTVVQPVLHVVPVSLQH